MKDNSGNPAAIPWFLTLSWWWFVVAASIQSVLLSTFHKTPPAILNVGFLWSLAQAVWLLKVDRRSQALYWRVAVGLMDLLMMHVQILHRPLHILIISALIELSVVIAGNFVFRRDMLRYFNEVDETGLTLSPWMTVFFGTIYFQYHFNEIAEFKMQQSLKFSLSQSK
jgi:hypothetical protein